MKNDVVGNIPPVHHDWYEIRNAIIEAKMIENEPLPVNPLALQPNGIRKIMQQHGEPATKVIK